MGIMKGKVNWRRSQEDDKCGLDISGGMHMKAEWSYRMGEIWAEMQA
jgi:hypothetical protein